MRGRILPVPLLLCLTLLVGTGCVRGSADRRQALTTPAEAPPSPVASTPVPRPLATTPPVPKPTLVAGYTPGPTPAVVRRVSLVGALKLDPFNQDAHADVAAYKNLAFVGKRPCSSRGVDIIDISKPEAPVKLSESGAVAGSTLEDMKGTRIGERDVLAIGLQACGEAAGSNGLQLIDITDPRQPQELTVHKTPSRVHEFDLTTTPDGRVLALLAASGLESRTADPSGRGGEGDLIILDITDPEKPAQLSEWGVLGEPALGKDVYDQSARGAFPEVFAHSARAREDGTRAYLSYWDAGVITLDISDPAKPTYLGRTVFQEGEEGNAHSVALAPDRDLLIQADEDFSPFTLSLKSNAFRRGRIPFEANYVTPMIRVPGRRLTGIVAHLGRGCPGGTRGVPRWGDRYLSRPRGKIALIEDGGCSIESKVARAQQAGATGTIVYEGGAGAQPGELITEPRSVSLLGGKRVSVNIPAVYVSRSDGLAMRQKKALTANLSAPFDGWGFLRFYDISDPARPVEVATFATKHTRNEAVAGSGMWSAHNPEVQGNHVYVSWYNDGVRVLDISDPSEPREVAAWTGEGKPADVPPVNIWSVVPHGDLLVASDFNYGLYILRAEP